MPTDTTPCLRPEFTRLLLKELQERQSRNLYGPQGMGKTRLVEDLMKMAPPEMPIIALNMVGFQYNHHEFIQAIHTQMRQTTSAPSTNSVVAAPSTLPQVLEGWRDSQSTASSCLVLILDHFDVLFDKPDIAPEYDETFFACLNAFKNRPQTALLVVTHSPYNEALLVKEDLKPASSLLDLNPMGIADLREEQIEQEVQRSGVPLETKQLQQLCKRVKHHHQPYGFLSHCLQRLQLHEYDSCSLRKRLKFWEASYEEEHRQNWLGKANRLDRWLSRWSRLTIWQKIPVLSLLKSLRDILLERLTKNKQEGK